MIKLVAFDWNGTILADTSPVLAAENAVRKEFGLKLTNLKEFQEQYDIPIKKYWLAAGVDEEVFDKQSDEIQRIFMLNYEPLEKFCRTRRGVRETLKWLKENYIGTCIFSNHPVEHIKVQTGRLKIRDFFDEYLGRVPGDNSHMHKRGKEDKLKAYVDTLNLKSAEVITVGDTIEEIEIGKNQGYTTVALTGGYQSIKRLKTAKPDYLIHNLIQLKDIIKI